MTQNTKKQNKSKNFSIPIVEKKWKKKNNNI
jgi:hypothetical protein